MSYLLWKMLFCLFLAALIGLIVGWLLRRIGAVQRELELNTEIDVRNERVGSLEGQIGERDGKIMSLGADLERWQAKVPDLEATIAERDDQVMGLTMDLDVWKQKVPDLETRLGDADAERLTLASDLASQTQTLEQRDGEVERLRGEVGSLRKQLAQLSERHASETAGFNTEITGQRQQVDSLRSELEASKAAHRQEQERTAALTENAELLRNDLNAQKKHSEDLTQEGRDREQAFAELRQSLKAQDAERLSLAEQVTSLSPVAQRVTSQDESIASLNQDLRNRDITIKELESQLDANSQQAEELQRSEASLGLLRTELGGMREELASARAALTTAARSTGEAASEAETKLSSNDKEWRARLRIADSGRQQAQADLYRRQEHIDRLQRQLAAAEKETASLKNSLVGSTAPAAGAESVALGLMANAGSVAATDDRQWKSRLRIEESARRRAEADAQRHHERVRRLEQQARQTQAPTRAAQERQIPTQPASVAASTPAPLPPVPVQAVPVPPENVTDSGARFLATVPQQTDDLQKIKGVGKVLQKTLNSLGIYQYQQIALFSSEDIDWVDDRLKFKGRIERDEWVKQADALHREKYGSAPIAD